MSEEEGGMINSILETLPVGYRFDPTDEELVYYLKLKIRGMDSQVGFIPEVDLCGWEPWQLPELSVIKTADPEWFFFNLPNYKYSKGSRSNRATKGGYWKPTGQDREIKSATNRAVVGTKKTLVFYAGRPPSAVKTGWVIHEYRADIAGLPTDRAYVLCRLKRKTEENIPSPDEAVADNGIHQNKQLANNMAFGAGSSCHSSNIGSTPLNDPNWCPDIYQGLDLDLPSPNSFNFSYGGMEFLNGDDFFKFADSFIVDPDKQHSMDWIENGSFHFPDTASTSYDPSF